MGNKLTIPYYKQETEHTCGPASLKMVMEFLGVVKSEEELAQLAGSVEEVGTTPYDLIRVSESLGLHCYVKSPSSVEEVRNLIDSGLPVIVSYYDLDEEVLHYSVIVGYEENKFIFNDPWYGQEFEISEDQFVPNWYDRDNLDKWIMVLSKIELDLGKNAEQIT